jgi:GNAT superfamily N-acetyltransferase
MILRCLYIDTPDPTFLRLEANYRADYLHAADLEPYVARAEYGLTQAFVARELAMGHECFGIREGDALATYGWYSTSPTHFTDDLSVRFGRQWVYMHSGFTHPAYRGRRLHAIAMSIALSLYRSQGYRGLVSIVSADNEPSLKSCGRMGYRHFGTIYTARLSRLRGVRRLPGINDRVLVFASPGCRKLRFSLDRTPVVSPHSAVVAVRPPASQFR